jgi:hypothetical protein
MLQSLVDRFVVGTVNRFVTRRCSPVVYLRRSFNDSDYIALNEMGINV